MLSTRFFWNTAELIDELTAGRLDFALLGVCGDASLPSPDLAWALIAVDAVFALLPEHHPLATSSTIDLQQLADADWVMAPGDSCFRSCFAAACARAGFTLRTVYEGDVRTCVELVETGNAVSLCQSSFRPPPGLVSIPLADTPLQWRHLLGWRPRTAAASQAERITGYAVAAYRDAVARLPRTVAWLADRPELGAPSNPN